VKHEAQVVSVSWIPSEAIEGVMKLPFALGVGHYDDPPPDVIENLDELHGQDRFRFANRLRAWIEVDKRGAIVRKGYSGGGLVGSTIIRKGKRLSHEFSAFAMPDIQVKPEVGDTWVRFVQTAGGRTGVPTPRRVRRAPFVQWRSPLAWTTLALTLHADGQVAWEAIGASKFPRHWIYGPDGKLAAKVGMISYDYWYRYAFGKHTPWGDEETPALVTAAETALERMLSLELMRGGGKPTIRKLGAGDFLMREGEPGDELYLVLDGVVRVDVGGRRLAEYGPGSIHGERALLEGGTRTATVKAVSPLRVAVARADRIEPKLLAELRESHRREELT
jgi:hypothetical protein